MYRAQSKRRQIIKRIFVYGLMTTAVTALVTFLVLVMLGYRINQETSTLLQGGLVQLASRPTDAVIKINNSPIGNLTPTKRTMNPGAYTISMSKAEYHDWSKSVQVNSGEVLWLNYAQLVPTDIQTEEILQFDAISGVKSSPNGDRFAVITNPAEPVLTFVDVTGDDPKQTTFTIPADVLPQDKQVTYAVSTWANDSDRMIVTASYDSVVERLLVDRRDASKTVNISKSYDSTIVDAQFDPRSGERIITRTKNNEVRIVDTASKSLSSVIARNVTAMSLYENDAILLVQKVADGGQSIGYVSLGSTDVRELKRIDSDEKTTFAIAKYFYEPYLSVAVGSQLDVYKVDSLPSSRSEDPISMTNIYSDTLPEAVDYLSMRTSGRFVVAQYPGGVQTYDLELKNQSLTSFKSANPAELRWLDKYHFYVTTGTELQVMEFDGANAHVIAQTSTTFDATQSDDGTFIYSFVKNETGFALQRSRMILEQ